MTEAERALAQFLAKRENGSRYEGFESTHREFASAILTALSSAGIDCEGWRTIESAPKDGTWVLIYDPSFEGEMAVSIGSYMTADERDKKGRFKCGEWCLFEWDGLPSHATPTHWRPLPLPPLASGGG